MKVQISILLFLILLIHSCNNQVNEIIKGSIYIKTIDLGSLYKASEEKINSLKKEIDTFDESKWSESEKLYYGYYKILFDNNLIDKPCFLIKDSKNNIKRIFSSTEDYKKIEYYLKNLDRNSEQINLSLNIRKINNDIFFAKKILSVEKVKGKTDWKK